MVARKRQASAFLRFLIGLPPGHIFTTRDLIPFASRSALDSALCRMVAEGTLERLARGVFRFFHPQNRKVSLKQITAIKRKSFGRKMATVATVMDYELLDRLHDRGRETLKPSTETMVSDGRSSSFVFHQNGARINLKSVAMRMKKLGESQAGRMLRDLWLMGNGAVSRKTVEDLWQDLHPSQKEKVTALKKWLPDWLVRCLPISSTRVLEELMIRPEKKPVQLKSFIPAKSKKTTNKSVDDPLAKDEGKNEATGSAETAPDENVQDVIEGDEPEVVSLEGKNEKQVEEIKQVEGVQREGEEGREGEGKREGEEREEEEEEQQQQQEQGEEEEGPRFFITSKEDEEERMRKLRAKWDEWKKKESDDDLEFH